MGEATVVPLPLMKEGDLVIAYCGRDNMVPLVLKSSAIFRNKFGEFRHDDMIGKPQGSRVRPPTSLGRSDGRWDSQKERTHSGEVERKTRQRRFHLRPPPHPRAVDRWRSSGSFYLALLSSALSSLA